MKAKSIFLVLLLGSGLAVSQQQSNTQAKIAADPQTIIVTGTFEPVPLAEANRSVVSLNTQEQPLLYNAAVDYLQLDSSIDLRQRETQGSQADLSIRGGSFEQSLVLLNGLRINDAQTGHHDLDLPVPLEAVMRIEVLHGAGSTLYGADAMAGAVNFISAPPSGTELRTRIGFGNFGFNQQRVIGSYLGRRWSERFSASRDSSSGFLPDRDFRSTAVSSETRIKTTLGDTDVLLAGSDRPFGADQFYGPFRSWERTKGWFGSLLQDLGRDTSAAFGYRRHTDEFVLVRDDPAIYENNHTTQSWQGTIRRRSTVGAHTILAYGIDAAGDTIDSTNLGHHARNRGAGYLNFDLQMFQRVFFSLGARDEIFSGGRAEFAPTAAGAIWLGGGWRMRVSASRAFRLPTYTDLYYSDPANLGNLLLKPESAWDFEGGPEWNLGRRASAELTVFQRREHNDIDYVKQSPSDPWQATNLGDLAFTGVETTLHLKLPRFQEVQLGYTWLHGSQQNLPGFISKYVFNYPSNNAVFSWLGQVRGKAALRTRVGITQRVGQDAYPVWDVAVARTSGRVRPYLQLSNLSNTGFQEIPGVVMPGRSVIGGVEFWLVHKVP
jgi:iron complex outermembrane receptor protein